VRKRRLLLAKNRKSTQSDSSDSSQRSRRRKFKRKTRGTPVSVARGGTPASNVGIRTPTSTVARGGTPETATSAITTSSNTSQTAVRKSPRLMKNRTSISSHQNSFMDIDAMAKLSYNKRKSKKDYDELSFDDGDSTDT
jgi:hypothetical protein